MSEENYRICQLALSAATFLAGIVLFVGVIWRDSLTKRIVRPLIRLDQRDFPAGELTRFTDGPAAQYWHLEVLNLKPWIIADEVELFLLSLSIGEDREAEQPMPGPLRIKARDNHKTGKPLGYKSITYDLFNFIDRQVLQLMIGDNIPNNLQFRLQRKGSFTAQLQALGNNAASNKMIVKVSWDGRKSIDDLENGSVQISWSYVDI